MKEAYKKCMKEKNTIKIKSYESPCGVLLLGSFGGKLCLCDWQVEKHCDRVNQRLKRVLCAEFEISTSEIIEESIEQLNEYFAGQRKEFSVPLLFVGTDFQKTVWNERVKIPFGRTISKYAHARKNLASAITRLRSSATVEVGSIIFVYSITLVAVPAIE